MANNNLPYPLQFDPSQWSNQFSLYNNQALPWPSSYAGTPTDALGNPIQPPQGTTLTSTPIQQPTPVAQQTQDPMINQLLGWNALSNMNNPNYNSSKASTGDPYLDQVYASQVKGGFQGAQQQAQPQQSTQPQNSWQQTLAMLANPGHVTTQGANVPQSTMSGGPQPGVLQSFLSNWKPAQSGPSSGFQTNFASALKGMGY